MASIFLVVAYPGYPGKRAVKWLLLLLFLFVFFSLINRGVLACPTDCQTSL